MTAVAKTDEQDFNARYLHTNDTPSPRVTIRCPSCGVVHAGQAAVAVREAELCPVCGDAVLTPP